MIILDSAPGLRLVQSHGRIFQVQRNRGEDWETVLSTYLKWMAEGRFKDLRDGKTDLRPFTVRE